MPPYNLKVDPENSLQRLDIFITKNLPQCPSRTFIKSLIEAGHVTVNGKTVKPHHKVLAGDNVVVDVMDISDSDDIEPQNIPLDVFYEDAYLLVINKPAGMMVHPATGCREKTLVNALLYYCRQLSSVGEKFRPGIVHRLDRETSGLMIVAKDNQSHVRLARGFEKHRVQKKYVALVKGIIAHEEGVVDVSLGKHPRQFDKKAVRFDENAKEARTFYRVIKTFDSKVTLVALFPETGRTHQLRVHMAYLGHPILGDDKYGKKDSFRRLALHAQSIGFQHPAYRVYVEFSTSIPEEFLRMS